ncbi:hypothetical protein EDI_284980 [Entamoeba dispar SAW760]|uniref:Uncharacterized protein n=1 Tax=Entamoeba dispar (strain ATCC PRA-260 / SAW760) TaxID=370354 RepID=B0EV73_ENTDS|nr:uncharacterized protein EDI_284980 [Entamoeba dispar SAW760]EDR21580.1 hypothetical protein EDI_284980 [Entamoeba dispar SAW760]|eukprot:EDR21580.1 hypothetical protein EDI_284980 [Entamoeba dispar SAW760]
MQKNIKSPLNEEELKSVVLYCPITCVFDLLFVNKKIKKAIQEAPRNPHKNFFLCKKEVKLFCKTDLLRGGMNELIHTLSDKKWKKRTLQYASFDVSFSTWHDYNKNKFYHLIAKDVVSLTLKETDIDTLLIILRESSNLKKLSVPLGLFNKININYPIEHLFNHFSLKQLILTDVDLNGSMISPLYSYIEKCNSIQIILKCISFNFKVIQELSLQPNILCCLYSLKELNSHVFPLVLQKKVILFCPFPSQLNKFKEFSLLTNLYLPYIISEELFDTTRLIFKGIFKQNINSMKLIQYFTYEETSILKKAKVIDLSSLNLLGLTLIGHKTKRKINLPISLKELKVVNFCDIDSFISPIGINGLRTFTSLTRLDVDGVEGIVNPPHSLHEFTASNCSVGKIQTKNIKCLYSLILTRVKLEELIIFEKLDQIQLSSVTGIRCVDYKNDCYSFILKEDKK